MRSVRLTDRGFSAIDMPILTKEQARILAGFDLVNLRSLLNGDESRRRKITAFERQLEAPNLDDGEHEKVQKQADDLRKELQTRVNRYAPMYEQWGRVQEEMPTWATAVVQAERYYQTRAEQPLAGQQFAKAGAKIGKAVQQISDLGGLVAEGRYAKLEPLLSPTPIDVSILPAGDGNTRICYGCGAQCPKATQRIRRTHYLCRSITAPAIGWFSETTECVRNLCRRSLCLTHQTW